MQYCFGKLLSWDDASYLLQGKPGLLSSMNGFPLESAWKPESVSLHVTCPMCTLFNADHGHDTGNNGRRSTAESEGHGLSGDSLARDEAEEFEHRREDP